MWLSFGFHLKEPQLSRWKSTESSTIQEWLSKIRYMSLMSKLTALYRCRAGQCNALVGFGVRWGPFLSSKYAGYQMVNIRDSILTIL